MIITVKDRQSLLDIAVQYLGGAEGVFSLASRNEISITDRLNDGQILYYELSDTVNERVQNFFENREVSPATDISVKEQADLLAQTRSWYSGCIIPPRRVKAESITTIGSEYDSNTNTPQDGEAADDVVNQTSNKVKKAASTGATYITESGKTLARIFTDQFNDIFA